MPTGDSTSTSSSFAQTVGWVDSPSQIARMQMMEERRRGELARIRASITPELVREMDTLASAYGNVVDPGALTSLAQYRAERAQSAPPIPTAEEIGFLEDPVVNAVVNESVDEKLEGGWLSNVHRWAKGAVRNTFAGFEAAWQWSVPKYIRPLLDARENDRSYREALRDEMARPTYAHQFFTSLATGTDFDLGEGWLPGGEVEARYAASGGELGAAAQQFADPESQNYNPTLYQDLEQMAINAPKIDGQPISLGRYTARGLDLEPGTTEYNLLSGLVDGAMYLTDPTNIAAKPVQSALATRRTMGLISTTGRKTIDVQKAADKFLGGGFGQKVINRLAESNNIEDVWSLLSSKGRFASTLDLKLVSAITETSDPTVVRGFLEEALVGGQIRQRPALLRHDIMSKQLPGIKRSMRDIRLLNDMPVDHISIQDMEGGFATLRNALINAKIDPETRAQILSRYAKSESILDIEDVMVEMATHIDHQTQAITGRKLSLAERYQNYFNQTRRELQEQLQKEFGGEFFEDAPWYMDRGEPVKALKATTIAEYTNGTVPVLDVRAVRDAVEKTTAMLDRLGWAGDALQLADHAMRSFMNSVWKPFQLIRGAWSLRVGGEQQMRFAAMGVDNAINSPGQVIATAMGMSDEMLSRTATGDTFTALAEYRNSLQRMSGGWIDDPGRKIRAGKHRTYTPDDPDYINVYVDEMDRLLNDAAARRVARSMYDPEYRTNIPVKKSGLLDEEYGFDVLDEVGEVMGRRGIPLSPDEYSQMKNDGVVDSLYAALDDAISATEVPLDGSVAEGRRFLHRLLDKAKRTGEWGDFEDLLTELASHQTGVGISSLSDVRFQSAISNMATELNLPEDLIRQVISATENLSPAQIKSTSAQTQSEIFDHLVEVLDPDDLMRFFDAAQTTYGDIQQFFVRMMGEVENSRNVPALSQLGVDMSTLPDMLPGAVGETARSPLRLRQHVDGTEEFFGVDAVKEWWWAGEGAPLREQQAADRARAAALDRRQDIIDPVHHALSDRAAADSYIDGMVEQIRMLTNGDEDLLRLIGEGKFQGRTLVPGGRNREIKKALHEKITSGATPQTLYGPDFLEYGQRSENLWRKFTDAAFDMLGTRPDNRFFRDPLYRHTYWERAIEMAPRLSPDEYQKLVKNAEKANISKEMMKRLKETTPTGKALVTDIDFISRKHALDAVRDTLYDLTRRSQMQESFALISPFLDAHREVLSFWTRNAAQNPGIIRKAQIGYEGARETGMFMVNEHGEEVFAWPGGNLVGRTLGLPGMTAEGSIAGLNLVTGSVLPGAGFVVQWPLTMESEIVDSVLGILDPIVEPAFGKGAKDALKDWAAPFGGPESIQEIPESLLPAWMRQFLTGFSEGKIGSREFENLVGQIATANVVQGRYSRDEVQENIADAKETAKQLFMIRGFANSFLPTGFRPKIKVEDINGELFEMELLAREYRDMRERHETEDEAIVEFTAKYGMDPLAISQPKSRQVVPRSTFDMGGAMWEKANPDLTDKYRLVAGLLAPLSGEPAPISVYFDAMREGDIVELSAEQQQLLANNILGQRQFRYFKEQMELTYGNSNNPAVRAMMEEAIATRRAELREELPGFDSFIGTIERPTLDQQLREIEKVVADEKFDTPAAQLLRDYWNMRTSMLAMAQAKGYTLQAKEGAAQERALLTSYGQRLADDHPDFFPIWNRILSRELA